MSDVVPTEELDDKIRPLHLLGMHENLFAEKVGLKVGMDFAEPLREARACVAFAAPAIEGDANAINGTAKTIDP